MKSAMTGGDLLGAADSIQKMAEGMLGGKFESVVSLDDFAHKHHFKVCVCFCKFQEIKSMQIKQDDLGRENRFDFMGPIHFSMQQFFNSKSSQKIFNPKTSKNLKSKKIKNFHFQRDAYKLKK